MAKGRRWQYALVLLCLCMLLFPSGVAADSVPPLALSPRDDSVDQEAHAAWAALQATEQGAQEFADRKGLEGASPVTLAHEILSPAQLVPPPGKVLYGLGQGTMGWPWDEHTWPGIQAVYQACGVMPKLLSDYISINKDFRMAQVLTRMNQLRTESWDPFLLIGISFLNQLDPNLPGGENNPINLQLLYSGQFDALLRDWGSQLKTYGRPVYIRPFYEINFGAHGPLFENYSAWHGGGSPEDLAKTAFRRVVDKMREGAGGSLPNVAWVWHVNTSSDPTVFSRWYPGDQYVDWVGASFYDQWAIERSPVMESFASSRGKPVMVCESGPAYFANGVHHPEVIPKYFQPYFARIENSGVIKAFVYVNWDWTKVSWMPWPDCALQNAPNVLAFFAQHISQPVFNPVTSPPIIEPNGGAFDDQLNVALSSPVPGAEIRYTLDGGEPGDSSPLYAGPFTLYENTTVKAKAYHVLWGISDTSTASFRKRLIVPDNGGAQPGTWQQFQTRHHDPLGWQHIRYAEFLINTTEAPTQSIYARYDVQENKLYLRQPADLFWMGGFAPGSANVIQHIFGSLDAARCSVVKDGSLLAVTWTVMPTWRMSGKLHNLYLRTIAITGETPAWSDNGDWAINRPPSWLIPPSLINQSVEAGKRYTFDPRYRDPDGWQTWRTLYLAIADSLPSDQMMPNAVFLKYEQSEGRLYLADTAGTYWLPIGGAEPGASLIVENDAVKVIVEWSSVGVADAKTRVVRWRLEFKTGFAGMHNVYMRGIDNLPECGGDTGWKYKGRLEIR